MYINSIPIKRHLVILVFFAVAFNASSQNASVEKSIFGIQTGLLGVWVYNESRLTDQIALRTEIGYEAGYWANFTASSMGYYSNDLEYIFFPVISLEPRWYYNLDKRVKKESVIDGNSGNFIALKTSYHPHQLVISTVEASPSINNILIVPTWGIRRNIGKHFNYETGIGFGYIYYFSRKFGEVEDANKHNRSLNLHLRIGYRF